MLDRLLDELAYVFSGQRWDRRTAGEMDALGRLTTLSSRIDLQRLEVGSQGPKLSREKWQALQAGVEAIEQEAYALDRLFFGNFAKSHGMLEDLQQKLKHLQSEFAALPRPVELPTEQERYGIMKRDSFDGLFQRRG